MRAILFILLFLLASCSRPHYLPQVRSEVRIDTITKVMPDSAMIRALLECDSSGKVLLRELDIVKGEMAETSLSISGNELKSQTRWRTQYIDRIVEIRDTITVVHEVEIVKQVRHIPRVYRWSLWTSIGSILLIIIKLILFIRG